MNDKDRELAGAMDRVIRVDRTDFGGLQQRSFRQISDALSALDFGHVSAPGLSFEPGAVRLMRRKRNWVTGGRGLTPWIPQTRALRNRRPRQFSPAPASERKAPVSAEPLALKGPPWLIGIPLYDGTCEELDKIIVRNKPAIDEATAHGVQFTRVGNPAEVCPVYEGLRGTWLKTKDEVDARAYRAEIESGVGEEHIRLREMHALCRRFGIARDQLPCIVFFPNPPSAPPAILKIPPEWIADQRARREFINALIDFFRSVELDRLAAECRTNVELAREFGRQASDYMCDRMVRALAEQSPKDSEGVDGGRRGKSVKTQRCFATPPGSRWQDVVVRVEDLAVTIQTKHVRQTFTFEEAGFSDRRKRGGPDLFWALLRIFATQGGVIPFNGPELPRKIRTNLKHYVSVLRQRLRDLIPSIDGDPVSYVYDRCCYRMSLKIASSEGVSFPVPDGAKWPNVTIVPLGSGAIRVSVVTTDRYAADAYVEGPDGDAHGLEVAQRESELERDYDLRVLGLADANGRPNAAGEALMEMLHANGAIDRPQDDDAMLGLCEVLSKLMSGIGGSPFEIPRGSEKWITLFRISFE